MTDAAVNDVVIVDVEDASKPNDDVRPKTTRKRKKTPTTSSLKNLSAEEKHARVELLRKELLELFRYYREVMSQKVVIEASDCVGSRNAAIAALMEEIFTKLKVGDLVETITVASVKSAVLSVGQRVAYGLPNLEADVSEDQSDSCFWCWETRDMKLIPKSVRGQLMVRRTCRKRIHERITAVSEMIASLEKLESEPDYNNFLIKASTKLGYEDPKMSVAEKPKKISSSQIVKLDKALKLAEIWVNNMSQDADDRTTHADIEGRPSRLGLGAKVSRQSKVGPSDDPVERKLYAKLGAEKRKRAKIAEESKTVARDYLDDSEDDEEEESRTSAFSKRKVVPLISAILGSKKQK